MGTCCSSQQIISDQSHEQINPSISISHEEASLSTSIYFQPLNEQYNEIILSENQSLEFIQDGQDQHQSGIIDFIQLYITLRNDALNNNQIPDLQDFIRFFQIIQSKLASTGLTQEEVEKLTIKQASNNDFDCPICLEMIKIKEKFIQLPCKHMFHPQCIKNWLQKSIKCPSCRRECVQVNYCEA